MLTNTELEVADSGHAFTGFFFPNRTHELHLSPISFFFSFFPDTDALQVRDLSIFHHFFP